MQMGKGLSPRRDFIIAREGWIFIFLFGLAASIFFVTGLWFAALCFAGLTFFTVYFFRNPERVMPAGEGLVISPADGTILHVQDVENSSYTTGPVKKVSIFMSVFNVHVNRMPISGNVKEIKYHPGKFLVASLDKASEHNERNAISLDIGDGKSVTVVQIAGLVARRIVCYLTKGERVIQGQRFGLIRFGSRVELYLPVDLEVAVAKGCKVKAGVTVIGRLK